MESLARLRVVLYADDVVVATSEDTGIWTDTLDEITKRTRTCDDGEDEDDEGDA